MFDVNVNTMEEAKKELEKERDKLLLQKQIRTLNSVNPLTVERTLEIAEALKQDAFNYGQLYHDFLRNFSAEIQNPDNFKVQNNEVIETIIAHADQLETKANDVKRASRDDAIQVGVNASQEAQAAQLQDLLTRQASLDTTKEVNAAKKRAETKAAQVCRL